MDQNPQPSQVTPKQQVAERLRQAVNVLVTVTSSPSVDELAATIGLTLMLNKLGKHATAVFSGQVPSTLEFLQPEETLEGNVDSLRDFIVSLDKSKADKLRYKVEENVVKIFITPYRTSITEADLEFTQGDFNVDVVMALGVSQREELDQAVVAHGRILHDATVVTVTAGQSESTLGNINWQEAAASSLCEMLVSISESLQGGIIDSQMATAFLTGIVAETQRFSNPKTSPKVMTMAAQLMAAGANQQLIANELEKAGESLQAPSPEAPAEVAAESAAEDGALDIPHEAAPETPPAETPAEEPGPAEVPAEPVELPAPSELNSQTVLPPAGDLPATAVMVDQEQEVTNEISIDEHGNMLKERPQVTPKHKVIQPLGETEPIEQTLPPEPTLEEATLPLPSQPAVSDSTVLPQPPQPEAPHVDPGDTLSEIEQTVDSPHVHQMDGQGDDATNSARNAVQDAIMQANFDPTRPDPRADLNAQPLELPQLPGEVAPQPGGEQPSTGDTLPPPPPVPPPFPPSIPS